MATIAGASGGVMYYGLDNIPASSAFLFAGLWCVVVQPDLDQIDGDKGYYGLYVLESTKKGLSKLWHRYWQPYAKVIPHRSFFSHVPIVGTLIRLLYGGWFLLPLLITWDGMPYFITCIMAFDTIHWVMDWKLWGVFGIFKQ